jgi:hypothetical protein
LYRVCDARPQNLTQKIIAWQCIRWLHWSFVGDVRRRTIPSTQLSEATTTHFVQTGTPLPNQGETKISLSKLYPKWSFLKFPAPFDVVFENLSRVWWVRSKLVALVFTALAADLFHRACQIAHLKTH